jgi:sarcosine oxidase
VPHDVIVLGCGGMGSAAAYYLARRGKRVLGLDRHPPAHDRGSSHGHSRIIREAYFEHPSYVPLVQRAYDQWDELERASGRKLLRRTGGINIGRPDSTLIRGALDSATTHGLQHEILPHDEVRRRFPVFAPADDMVGVFEPRAGILQPEECVTAHLGEAARAGAELHHEETVTSWTASAQGVEVATSRGRYSAGRLVITAGPWAPTILADLGVPFVVTRQMVPWFQPISLADAFEPARCPIHLWQVGERQYYGIPRDRTGGVKVAEHTNGTPTTADTIERAIQPAEIDALRNAFVARHMPAANGPVVSSNTCMYTMTPDAHFIIDHHPRHSNVAVACGFSGHGFKFAAVVGEILADLALDGSTRHDIGLFSARRFGGG